MPRSSRVFLAMSAWAVAATFMVSGCAAGGASAPTAPEPAPPAFDECDTAAMQAANDEVGPVIGVGDFIDADLLASLPGPSCVFGFDDANGAGGTVFWLGAPEGLVDEIRAGLTDAGYEGTPSADGAPEIWGDRENRWLAQLGYFDEGVALPTMGVAGSGVMLFVGEI
jgi:hypothetical protein